MSSAPEPEPEHEQRPAACDHFVRTGLCKFGAECRLSHASTLAVWATGEMSLRDTVACSLVRLAPTMVYGVW